MGSKSARHSSSVINRDSGGGNKKAGSVSSVGHPSNLGFRLCSCMPDFSVSATYGSTTKGMVGGIRVYRS
jgi:hypothetical protein